MTHRSGISYGPREAGTLEEERRSPRPFTQTNDWNDETTIQLLRDLWAAGHSASEIGRRMGTTKNAVLGKAHRLDLPERPSPITRRDPNAPPRVPHVRVHRATGPTLPPLASTAAPEPEVVPTVRPRIDAALQLRMQIAASSLRVLTGWVPGLKVEPVPIERVKAVVAPKPYARTSTCCWPIGEPATSGFRFCEEPHRNRVYCDEHQTIAYVRLRRDDVMQQDAAD